MLSIIIWRNPRFWKFALVGFSGVGVNMAVFYMTLSLLRLPVVAASAVAAIMAMFSNFLLNDRFTWPELHHLNFLNRVSRFYFFCGVGIVINAAVLSVLHLELHLNEYLAQMAGILTATVWNFTANNRWTWGA